MVAVNVFAADTDKEARRQFSSLQQAFVNLRRGQPGPVPAPVDDITKVAEDFELQMASNALAISAVGSPQTVEGQLRVIIEGDAAGRTHPRRPLPRSRRARCIPSSWRRRFATGSTPVLPRRRRRPRRGEGFTQRAKFAT